MNKSESQDEPERLCSYCGKPPRDGKKLKRCSRCHHAFYHDAHCQRSDFAKHKLHCQQHQARLQRANEKQSYTIESRSGRGKGMIANETIKKGSWISPSKGWMPPIAPVLLEQYRTSRCALCFNVLGFDKLCFNNAKNPVYDLYFCGNECREVASKTFQMDAEARAIQKLCKMGRAPPKIYSTAILLYRILLARRNSAVSAIFEQLQSKPQQGESEERSNYHSQAVIATVMGMLHSSESENLSGSELPSVGVLTDYIQRIKVNGFSICDGEFVCCGVGLYSPANFMNHSCQPNAFQSFLFEKPKPPSLFVAAFEEIAPKQEICISYTDTSCPTDMRQQQLSKDYFFDCNCEACMNVHEDAIRMGIKCLACKTFCVVPEKVMGPSREPRRYRCEECNATLSTDDTTSLSSFLESFEQKISNNTTNSVKECQELYEKFKQQCFPSSWYVQESGERLLQAHLDQLSQCPDGSSQQQQTAHKALQLCEELLHSEKESNTMTTTSTSSSFLRRQQLKYKAAKLRLFVDPDPRRSIQELQEVLSAMSPYYPSKHELVIGLKSCLQNAMM